MQFIPGALTLDGASIEENRAATEEEAKISTNHWEKLKIATVLSEGVDWIETGDMRKKNY